MTDNDRTKTHKTDVLLDKARRQASANLSTLEEIAVALFDDGAAALSELERSLMDNALRSLVRNIESRILAALAQPRDAPRELVKLFGRDAIVGRDHADDYAYPILEKSAPFYASGLIEVIKHRMQSHRLTLALLKLGRESSITSPMEKPQGSIIQSLLVAPEPGSVVRLKVFIDAESKRTDAFQNPLIRPVDLPPSVMNPLCWWIAAALRRYAINGSAIDRGMIDGCIEPATKVVIDDLVAEASPANEADGVIDMLTANGQFSADILLQLLSQGEVSLFEAGFAQITGLRKLLVSRLLFEPGGESLAVACKAVGFEPATFAAIYGYTRHGRLTADPAQDRNQDIVDFYDGIDRDAAEAVLERWRRDADFLYAIKLLEQAE